ncbi:TolB family protein, partial [Brevundimonas sp.]|uniref:TolB family protein n=1 Tax=Brevundimonas sp. TaxID=1871086 RepID=UPI0035B30C17
MHGRSMGVATTALILAAGLAMTGPALAQDAAAQAAPAYQDAPAPIDAILDTDPTPTPSLSPDRERLALFDRSNLPPISELAEPMLKLAGYRINPRNNGPANSRVSWLTGLSFQPIAGGEPRRVALPGGARLTAPSWSPTGDHVAFLMGQADGLELWVADAASGEARRLTDARVNAASGSGFSWLPDGSGLVARMTPEGRGAGAPRHRPPPRPHGEGAAGPPAPPRAH